MRAVQPRRLMSGIFCLLFFLSMGIARAAPSDDALESVSRQVDKCRSTGRRTEAEGLLRRKITMQEKRFGSESAQVTDDLNNLSNLYSEDGKYAEAEIALRNSLALRMKTADSHDSTIDYYLVRLADLETRQRRFAEGAQLYEEVLTRQREAGREDFAVLAGLAELYRLARDYSKAEETNERALDLELKSQEPGSGCILGTIERLGTVYEEQGKYEKAEALYLHAVESGQKLLQHGDLTIIANLNDLALFYERRARFQEAATFYERALDHFGTTLSDHGVIDSNLAIVIGNYSRLLRTMGRVHEAEQFEARVKATGDSAP